MNWTRELADQLKALVLAGNTAAHTARVLGMSRAAVIGKAARLGFAFGSGLSAEASERHQMMNSFHRSIDMATGTPKAKKTPPKKPAKVPKYAGPQLVDPDLAPGLPLPIGAIESYPEDSAICPKTCRYVYGDTSKPGWQWCGHPTVTDRPYCEGHHQRFHTEARPRAHSPGPRRRHASKGRFGVFT